MCSPSTYAICCVSRFAAAQCKDHARLESEFQEARDRMRNLIRLRNGFMPLRFFRSERIIQMVIYSIRYGEHSAANATPALSQRLGRTRKGLATKISSIEVRKCPTKK
jgi:hypothetical protein